MTDKTKEMDRIADLIWKKKAVTDMEVFEAFWDMNDQTIRDYAQNRWFMNRKVGQNHITRKLGHFWPRVIDTCDRLRSVLFSDPTHPKMWVIVNYKSEPRQLGYVEAMTRSEALSKFDYLFPVFESEGKRAVESCAVMPASRVAEEVLRNNADAAKQVSDKVGMCADTVARYTLLGEQTHLRLDAMSILLSMQAPQDEEEIPSAVDISQDDHESPED